MELTIEQLTEKVFPLYFGCEVRFGYKDRDKDGRLTGKDERFGWQVFDPSNIMEPYHCVRHELIKLYLTPLENITDADAIACYDVLADPGSHPADIQKISRVKLGIRLDSLDYRRVDFLRSKGYHIPYMGIDLFLIGIAIERTPTAQPRDKEQEPKMEERQIAFTNRFVLCPINQTNDPQAPYNKK